MIRTSFSMNGSWRFCRGKPHTERPDETAVFDEKRVWEAGYDDSKWEVVHLPHTVREEALVCSGGRNYQGIAWYRKRFFLTEEQSLSDLLLEFEGVMQRIDVWLDGEPLGVRKGGFLPHAFDLTGRLAPGEEHLLVCRTDNTDMPDVPPGKPQGQLDFCYFGGIYRDVWLHAMNKLRFSVAEHEGKPASGGIFVRMPSVSKDEAVIRVKGHILNHTSSPRKARMRVSLDGDEKALSPAFTVDKEWEEDVCFTVRSPRLWHPDHPELYELRCDVLDEDGNICDTVRQRIGIRELSFRSDGAYINGEKIFLSGANRHQEYPYIGFALPDSAQYRDVKALRDSGVTVIRTAHYPQDRSFMDACDELGVLCVIPTPGWQIHPESVEFDMRSYENTRRLIRRDRNRPSAAIWEPILNETDYPEYFARQQLAIVREEMGDAPAWAACDGHYAWHEHYPINYGGFRRMKGAAAVPRFVREYGDSFTEQFGPMGTLRRVRRGEGVSFYPGGERAMIRSAQEHFEDYACLRMIDGLLGAAMWAGIDHNRGYDESEGAVGMLDALRLKKFWYFLFEAQQDIEKAGPKCFIANYWTEDSPRDVAVYTNAQKVRLLLNGREIATLTAREGWKNTPLYCTRKGVRRFPMPVALTHDTTPPCVHPIVTFPDVPFEKGVLTAEAIQNDEVVARFSVRTPEEPYALRLIPAWNGREDLIADGSDAVLVHACVVDRNGTVCPTASNEISFSVEGCAQIAGDGEKWTGANPVRAEAGMTGVLVRAGTVPSEITVTAVSDGLKSGSAAFRSRESDIPEVLCPAEKAPDVRPVYDVDKTERFSTVSNMKLDSWYHLDVGKGKPACASSEAEGCPAGNANTGRIAQPWIAKDGACPQWWMCDLETPHYLYGVTASWYNDGVWYDYTVQTSLDGNTWTDECHSRSSGQLHQADKFSQPRLARYVRITVHSVSGGEDAGMYLLEIFGTPAES